MDNSKSKANEIFIDIENKLSALHSCYIEQDLKGYAGVIEMVLLALKPIKIKHCDLYSCLNCKHFLGCEGDKIILHKTMGSVCSDYIIDDWVRTNDENNKSC